MSTQHTTRWSAAFLVLLAFSILAAPPAKAQLSTSACPVTTPNAKAPAPYFVVLGDSLAFGIGASDIGYHTGYVQNGFACLLYQDYHAANPGIFYDDRAVGGTPVQDIVASQLHMLPQGEKVATILVNSGSNDVLAIGTLATFQTNVNTLFRALKKYRCRVHVNGLPNVTLTPLISGSAPPSTLAQLADRTRRMNLILRNAVKAAGQNFEFFDFYDFSPELLPATDYSSDGFHPDDAGYRAIAAAIKLASSCGTQSQQPLTPPSIGTGLFPAVCP